jgi:drug/metabolite transporter (DMT)-like permease
MFNERQALIAAICAVALWSTVATGFKLGLMVMAPVQLLLLGAAISTVVFVLAATLQGWPRTGWKFREAALFGLLNPVSYYLLLFEAYDRLPAQLAQPLNYTWAIVLALLAVPVLKQRLTARSLFGIAVSYLGVVVLLSQGRFDRLPDIDLLGVALALASTVLWAGYWLFNARSSTPPAAFMASSFCIATPILALLCLLGPGLPEITPQTLAYGAWVGLVEMGLTFLLWQRALRLTRHAARLGQLIFLSPFISLLLIGQVLEEQVALSSWLGLGIIVLGLLVTGRPKVSSQPDTL